MTVEKNEVYVKVSVDKEKGLVVSSSVQTLGVINLLSSAISEISMDMMKQNVEDEIIAEMQAKTDAQVEEIEKEDDPTQ